MAALSACSSTNRATPPPTGGFNNTDLNGTYVFSTSGSDSGAGSFTGQSGFLAMAGTFTACGCTSGTISSGTVDVYDSLLGASGPLAIASGNYSVGVDGRGTATLPANTPFGTPITLDFVLSSSQHGLVTEFDQNGSGSGTLDLQSSVAQASLAGTFVFNLAGVSSGGTPEATVGSVTLDATGTATTGVQDLNLNGASSTLTITSPSAVLVGTGTSPGTATLGAFSFDVYPIDSTHLKFIETDTGAVLVGDVFLQSSSSFPSGELAFTMVGLDFTAGLPLAVGGMMNSNGTSSISAGVEDFNDGGTSDITSTSTTPLAFTGGISSSGGRFLLTLNNIENGANGTLGNFTFAAYPSTGGTQLLEIDGLGITGGAAFPQSNTSFASGQGYGLNLTGSNITGGFEEDDIAEFTNTSGALKGLVDINDQGQTQAPQNFSGTYAADSTNPGRGLISSSAFNLTTYTLDSTNSIFIEIDNSQVGLGSIGQQASAAQGAIATRMAALRPRAMPRGAWKRKQADDRSR